MPKTNQTPKSLGFRMPAEWENQEAIWLSWPHNQDTWPKEMLKEVENSYLEFVKALCEGQKVKILVNDKVVLIETPKRQGCQRLVPGSA